MPSDPLRLRKHFGDAVRSFRVAARLSQMQLAERADLTLNYVGEIERGEKLASLETIVKLAAGLELSAADLLKRSGL